MRQSHKISYASIAAMLLLAACGEVTVPEATTPSTPPAYPGGRTVIVDSLQMSLVGTAAAARETGIFRFVMAGEPQQVLPGDVIVGVQDGGFLRRVTRVTRQGDVLELVTTQADLAEAIGEGSFERAIPISFNTLPGPTTSVARYTLGAVQVENLASGITLGSTGLDLNNLTLFNAPVCASGQTRNCPQVKVGIQTGRIGLNSNLELGASVSFSGVNSAFVRLDGTAAFTMDGFAELTGGARNVSWSRSLGSVSRAFVTTAGPIPITGKVTTELVAKVTLDVNSATRLNAGFSSSATASVGAQWSRSNGFQKILGVSTSAGPLPLRVTSYPQATLKVTIEPKVVVSVLGIPGDSYAGIIPYMSAQVRGDPSRKTTPYTLGWGVDAEAGVNFRIFNKSLGSWNYTAHLYDRVLKTG